MIESSIACRRRQRAESYVVEEAELAMAGHPQRRWRRDSASSVGAGRESEPQEQEPCRLQARRPSCSRRATANCWSLVRLDIYFQRTWRSHSLERSEVVGVAASDAWSFCDAHIS
jgi:hypothetical protein